MGGFKVHLTGEVDIMGRVMDRKEVVEDRGLVANKQRFANQPWHCEGVAVMFCFRFALNMFCFVDAW